ncbi:MAG: CoA transferase [Pseudonocardiaceae bacterium]
MLEESILSRRGESVALDISVRHLQALGCAIATSSDAFVARGGAVPPDETPRAGFLRLNPSGRGGPPGVDCGIDWAGPVDAPLCDEVSVQATCGIMQIHGRKSGTPEVLFVDLASNAAGLLATQGILAALIGQLRGINVQHVATSVSQAALLCVTQYLAAATADDDDWTETEGTGGPPFTSADGVRFEIEVLEAAGWQHFWGLLDVDQVFIGNSWDTFLRRYATATCPLPDELYRAALAHDFSILVEVARRADISILRLRDAAAWAAERSARQFGDPPPWRITSMPDWPAAAALPRSTTAAELPLEGVRVIEACRRVQGPLAGYILGLLGAQVIRIEPPGGDLLRGMPPMAGDCSARFLALNWNKESVEIDLKSAAGRWQVHELVAGADVFVHNWAPGRAAKLGLDSEQLMAVRPGLVYAYASGWGDAFGARPPLGTDFMVQAHSGLATLVRPPHEDPAPTLLTLTDVLGGLVCAEGVLAGLLARVRTGEGQRVDSSLLSAAMDLQESVRKSAAAWTLLHRALPTSDGYLVLTAQTRHEPDRVAAVCGVQSGGGESALAEIVGRLQREPTKMWLERLDEAGLSAVPVCTDLAAIAVDSRFSNAFHYRGCALPRTPWKFSTPSSA